MNVIVTCANSNCQKQHLQKFELLKIPRTGTKPKYCCSIECAVKVLRSSGWTKYNINGNPEEIGQLLNILNAPNLEEPTPDIDDSDDIHDDLNNSWKQPIKDDNE